MSGVATGEGLPASHDDIDIGGVELETVTDTATHRSGDQCRARAEKRVIDCFTGPAVVDDWSAHAFDWLLRAMPPALLALRAESIVIANLPQCRLLAVAGPVAESAGAHPVPASLVLPMIMTAGQCEMLFGPNDLIAKLKSAGE